MSDTILAVLTGGSVLVALVLFRFSMQARRGALSVSTELPFVLPLLALFGLLLIAFLSGSTTAILVPPLVLAVLGGAMALSPSENRIGPTSVRGLGLWVLATGVVGFILGLVRLALSGA